MYARTVAERLDRVQLVDVRLPNEWEAGHIEGAVHIPQDDLAARLDQIDRARPVVIVCRAGTRSEDAAELLKGRGYDAESLEGGLLAWKWAGLPLTGPIVEPAPSGPPAPSGEMQAFHDGLIEISQALQQRFGAGVEPTEEQVHEFLRERLIDEGRTPGEADAFLAEMGGD